MKNTTILSLLALAACSSSNDTAQSDAAPEPPVEVEKSEFDSYYDLSWTTMSAMGSNVIDEDTLFAFSDTVTLAPNSRNVFLLDIETFIVREGCSLDLGLTAPEGQYLVEYRFPFVAGVEVDDWASCNPDGFSAWATTSSVGFTRDSIAPFIDYDLPTDLITVTGLLEPGVLETEPTDSVRGTIEVIISNLGTEPIDVAVQALAIGG